MKPLIIGMNNPLSMRPEYALWPDPPNCTGWRLWQMVQEATGATQDDYIDAFDRINLVIGRWDTKAAKLRADQLMSRGQGLFDPGPDDYIPMVGRTVVLLGRDVAHAFRLPRLELVGQSVEGVTFHQVPHPSGLNLWYNNPYNRDRVVHLLGELYEGNIGSHGKIARQHARH